MQYNTKVTKLPKSEVELECAISAEELEKARPKVLKQFSNTLNIDGFRKGNIPEKIILDKVGEKAILDEAAEFVLAEHYPKILTEAKLDTIGRPAISITKLALGNPLEFKVRTAILPDFKLPDYKKIVEKISEKKKGEETKIDAEEKEINDVLLQIRKNKAHLDWSRSTEATQNKHGDHGHPDFNKEENLPELNDEFAKTAGTFENVADLKTKVKENIIAEKKIREVEKMRGEILEALLKATSIELPDILIISETEKSLAQMKDDVTRMNGKFADYLTHIKKTEDDIRKDMQENSIKKAKIQLIFNRIAEAEKIEPNKEILEHEVAQIMEHYKNADPDNARIYVTTTLLNQEVLKLLEQR